MTQFTPDESDPRPALEQIVEAGWRRRFDCKLDQATMDINPDIAPPILPVSVIEFRGDKIYLYDGGFVLLMKPGGGWYLFIKPVGRG